ncbi:hypothetical protein L9F63_000115, partial [Diploptera punctata]
SIDRAVGYQLARKLDSLGIGRLKYGNRLSKILMDEYKSSSLNVSNAFCDSRWMTSMSSKRCPRSRIFS